MSTRASSHISAGGSLRAFVSRVVLGEQGSWTIDLETMGRVVLPKLGVCIASACICVFAPSVAMAPKKRPPGGAPAAAPMKKVARQRASRTTTATQAGAADEVARPVRNVATAVVQATAPESLVAPLAGILGKRVGDLPSIRKIRLPDGMFVSVYETTRFRPTRKTHALSDRALCWNAQRLTSNSQFQRLKRLRRIEGVECGHRPKV